MLHVPNTVRQSIAEVIENLITHSARTECVSDEQAAICALFAAWHRLQKLGWRDGKYCPKDGTHFRVIELGSTGIFDCVCDGVWPDCTWTTFDHHDAYPSSQAPAMFRLYPEDEAKSKARPKEAVARYQAEGEFDPFKD